MYLVVEACKMLIRNTIALCVVLKRRRRAGHRKRCSQFGGGWLRCKEIEMER